MERFQGFEWWNLQLHDKKAISDCSIRYIVIMWRSVATVYRKSLGLWKQQERTLVYITEGQNHDLTGRSFPKTENLSSRYFLVESTVDQCFEHSSSE